MRIPFTLLSLLVLLVTGRGWAAEKPVPVPAAKVPEFSLSPVESQPGESQFSEAQLAYVLRPEIQPLLHQYLSGWRFVRSALTGDDLLALGLKPGPAFRRWLWGLRAARLDGAVADRAGELALIHQWTGVE